MAAKVSKLNCFLTLIVCNIDVLICKVFLEQYINMVPLFGGKGVFTINRNFTHIVSSSSAGCKAPTFGIPKYPTYHCYCHCLRRYWSRELKQR